MELLTVITIIGILAAILIPVIGRVRESAKAAGCMSNLRQIGVAMFLYAQTNKNKLPMALDNSQPIWNHQWWQWQLQPYLENKQAQSNAMDAVQGGIFRCPGKTNYDVNGPTDRNRISYGMNAFSDGGDVVSQRALNSLSQPAITLLVSDINLTTPHIRNWSYLYINPSDIALWHADKNNMLFADGHVEALPTRSLNYYLMKSTETNLRP